MKKLVTIVGLLTISFSAMGLAQTERKLVESCYSTTDTDLDGVPQKKAITVEVFQTPEGLTADLKFAESGKVIASQVQLTKQSSADPRSYRYLTPDDINDQFGYLDIYPTAKTVRTPTTVNAHLAFFTTNPKESYRVDRLECKKL